jgi:hypothetical protein
VTPRIQALTSSDRRAPAIWGERSNHLGVAGDAALFIVSMCEVTTHGGLRGCSTAPVTGGKVGASMRHRATN